MSRIPDEIITEIRERADIVAVVGQRVELKKAGRSWRGLCPFHHEKTPSFHVVPDKHFFHCFGCGKSGDAIKFVMELDGESFVEAVKGLGQKLGITVEHDESPQAQRHRSERVRLLEINTMAAQFFRDTLLSPAGSGARAYLVARGIGDQVAETFRLGMAPAGWSALTDWLAKQNVAPERSVSLGLIGQKRNGSGYYDRFRNRLVCPILGHKGDTLAFSARVLDDNDQPKYTNSPGSTLYTKGEVLYGLHAARSAFHDKGRAILVEGNFDVIALSQAGFAETVAPLGTALTDKQVQSLRLTAAQVILCLDGDTSGRAAAMKHLHALVAAGVETRVALLPKGADPDSFVRTRGAQAFEELLQKARPAVEYFIHEVWMRTDQASADQRAAAINEAAPLLAKVADAAKREMLTAELAQAMRLSLALVRRAVAKGRLAERIEPALRPAHAGDQLRIPTKELKILAVLVDQPDLLAKSEQLDVCSVLTNGHLQAIYSALVQGVHVMDALPSDQPELKDVVVRELLSGQFKSLEDPNHTLDECVRTLRRERLQHEVRALHQQIKEAERRGDSALARELTVRHFETRSAADSLRN